MISFIVLTYNHENYILDCLNSILYQIINYGNEFVFELIIADDCSADDTCKLVEKWIEHNSIYFKSIEFIKRKENVGTCCNYLNAISYVNGDKLKAIAGDDLFPSNNIIKYFELLNSYDIIYGIPFEYYEDISMKESINNYVSNEIYEMINSKFSFENRIKKGCFLNAPATFVNIRLLKDPRVLSFMSEFKYVDDYCQWLKFIDIKRINALFVSEYFMVYRRTLNSACIIRNDDVRKEKIRLYKKVLFSNTKISILFMQLNNIIVTLINKPFAYKYFVIPNYKLFLYKKIILIKNLKINVNEIEKKILTNIEYIKKIGGKKNE
ncbi:MAG: glycosyltransferase family 2 protein [Bacilli bacterium]